MTYYYPSKKVKHICLVGDACVVTTTDSRYILPLDVSKLLIDCLHGMSEEDLYEKYHAIGPDYEPVIHQVFRSNIMSSILESSTKYMPSNKPILYGTLGCFYPQQIIIELTNLCNLSCTHCYKNATQQNPKFQDYNNLSKLSSFIGINVPQIVLTGGEPLLHPHINELIRLFHNKDIIVKTNGTYLNHLKPEVVNCVRLFSISAYGLSNNEYKQRTGNGDGFSDLVAGLNYIANQSVDYEITVTLSKNKIAQMRQYAEFAYNNGAKSLSFGIVSKEGRAQKTYSEWELSVEELRWAYKEIRNLGEDYSGKLNILQWERPMIERFVPKTIAIGNQSALFCGAGLFHWTVTENFCFKPCVTMSDSEFLTLSFDTWKAYVQGKYEINWNIEINKVRDSIIRSGRSLKEVCSRL